MSQMTSLRWIRLAFLILPLLALAVSGCGSVLLAPEFSHQGRLLNDSGQPVADGNH